MNIDNQRRIKVLVIGASGMLGNAMVRLFAEDQSFSVWGTVRNDSIIAHFNSIKNLNLIPNVDILDMDVMVKLHYQICPHLVINCVGVVKQIDAANDPLASIPINSLLPHRLARLSQLVGARFIQISTDCVFSGKKGDYVEDDFADADDLYGRTKLLGEVNYPNSVTLRTSIIGHELQGNRSLVDWFLSQKDSVNGYRNAIFSGLPTVELAKIIRDFVVPNEKLTGLYHVSANPISKFDLLKKVSSQYSKQIEIIPVDTFRIDRSLNSSRFKSATGYKPKSWTQLINDMYSFH